jgi:hypothetical protein
MFAQESRRPGAEAAIVRGDEAVGSAPVGSAPASGTVLLDDDLEQVAAAGSNSIRIGAEPS